MTTTTELATTVQAFYATPARANILLDVDNLDGHETSGLEILGLGTSGPIRFEVGDMITIDTFDGSGYIATITDIHDQWSRGGVASYVIVDLD